MLAATLVVWACTDDVASDELGTETDSADATDGTDTTDGTDDDIGEETGPPSDMPEASPCGPQPCEDCVCLEAQAEPQWACNCDGLTAEAGFVEVEPIDYQLGLPGDHATTAVDMHSTRARLFWSYQPADFGVDDRPVFVFFNGGPGVSSGMLLGLSTGPRTFDPAQTGPDATVADNPASWTSLGNLLWIDARQTGFSHGIIDPPDDPSETATRNQAMALDAFNTYFDAADFVRVLLRFLADHPTLRDNPIVIVGESYGGTRAQILLDMLLQPGRYTDGARHLLDTSLVAEIEAHHAAVLDGEPAEPEAIAEQFGHQVLIQPAMTGDLQRFIAGQLFEQPGSPVHALADELGATYQTCEELGGACSPFDNAIGFVGAQGRSPYDTRAPYSWLDDVFDLVDDRLNDSATTTALLGVDPTTIDGLAAADRADAWRAVSAGPFPSDHDAGDWPDVLGELQPWDRYFVVFHHEVLGEFNQSAADNLLLDPTDTHFGELFLSNLRWVESMITVARYDLVVYTPALPDSFTAYADLVLDVTVDEQAEQWVVEYSPAAFPDRPEIGARVIAAPTYEASHAVTLDEPAKIRADVAAWMGLE